ncbi:MAG TPA: UpxY family transcription antiterminator [Chitinophagaceae bacterium]|jgi:transcription antitermination factor NusG
MSGQNTRKWYAVYTRPRWEKKVDALLKEKGIESYCPLNKTKRKWSDRLKTIEEPLFKSYVFVKVCDQEKTAVRMTPGVVNFVYWNQKPAIIKEREIQTIRRFLNEYDNIEVYPKEFKTNDRVRVLTGTLMDLEGKVLDVRHRIVKVAIDSLGYVLVAFIERTRLTSAQSKKAV